MTNQSILAAFERLWQHVLTKVNNYATTETLDAHIDNKLNPHGVTKEQVGLGNVDNTADADKSVNYAATADSATKATQDADGNVIASTYETKTDATAKLDEAKGYADSAISTHNTSTEAHSDIRTLVSDLSTKVNSFLDVDDTTSDQLSEVLAMIEANEGTIESLTSNKVNVSDIVDNLTTASADKVLSANQGVVLKGLIDDLQEAVNSTGITVDSALSDSSTNPVQNKTNGNEQKVSTASSGGTVYNTDTITADYAYYLMSSSEEQ